MWPKATHCTLVQVLIVELRDVYPGRLLKMTLAEFADARTLLFGCDELIFLLGRCLPKRKE